MDNTVTEQELKRKEDELRRLLEELRQSGIDNAASRNQARADVEIDLLLGRYRDKPPKWAPNQSLKMREWSPERAKAFAIEARRDALVARLNTDSILTRLKRLEKVERSLLLLEFMVGACLIALVVVIALQIFGWTTLSGLFVPVDAGLPE